MRSRSHKRARALAAAAVLSLILAHQVRAEDKTVDTHTSHAQTGHDAKHMNHEMSGMPPRKTKPKPSLTANKSAASDGAHRDGKNRHDMAGHNMSAHDMSMNHGAHSMKGYLGPYRMMREASGTSWQPDTSPHEGIHQQLQDWSVMHHGWLNLVYDKQGGSRGANKTFVGGMMMTMAQRQLGDGTFGVRAMLSPEPFMGANGYPLLLATGETADGKHHLIDRQHPHDLFMELAATYSHTVTANSSVFIYGGLPGEPALGPPAFMHRTSGMDNPEAPISHHWLDSTHITFGVVTAGVVLNNVKIEGSAFRGREPDQFRYDIERPSLDSFAGRVSWNPLRELSMQVSYGHLKSPEQLEPRVDEDRVTASAIYTRPFGNGHLWSTTAAWGRKMLQPGDTLDAFLLESSVIFKTDYTLFMRAERVNENELTDDIIGLEGRRFTVNKLSVGGIYDFVRTDYAKFGIGGLVSTYALPDELLTEYGRDPTSFMVFGRMKIR